MARPLFPIQVLEVVHPITRTSRKKSPSQQLTYASVLLSKTRLFVDLFNANFEKNQREDLVDDIHDIH